MNKETLDTYLAEVTYPVLILSSRAGLGNYSVGRVIEKKCDRHKGVHYRAIEDLLPEELAAKDFERYRFICMKAPFLLHLIYRFPFIYWRKYFKEGYFGRAKLDKLLDIILYHRVKTVIATNHRAAFWVSLIKKKLSVPVTLWVVVTDYSMNMGWKYLFWDQVRTCFGPVKKSDILPEAKYIYRKIEMPVEQEYSQLSSEKGDKNQVLITGGGWGLGSILNVTRDLSRTMPSLKLHIACGNNKKLYKNLAKHSDKLNAVVYKELDTLQPLLKVCGSVITKPGAVTLSEAHAARRKIFLMKGLPVCEESNKEHAQKHFRAERYSRENFVRWFDETKK